jgi:hypothetical protein
MYIGGYGNSLKATLDQILEALHQAYLPAFNALVSRLEQAKNA